MDRTLVICKPDAVERRLVGDIIGRLEQKGLHIVAAELRTIGTQTAAIHYEEHQGKAFYADLVAFITRGPAMLLVVEGPQDTWKVVRTLIGVTTPTEAARARSVGISPSRPRRTWSTAPTGPNRRNGRSPFFSPPWGRLERSSANP